MLKVLLLPLLALIGGAGGFFLRRWELATAFEASGLAISGAPATICLAVLGAVLTAVFALLCRSGKRELKGYADAFSALQSWPYLVVAGVGSAPLLVAGLMGLAEELGGGDAQMLPLLLWLMCIVSFACVLVTILHNFRAQSSKYSLALLAPAYMCCLWLVTAYQQRAADPVVLDYVYQVLAIICTLLGFYFTAGFSFGHGKVWRCAVFSLMGIYFSMVALADGQSQSMRLLFLFAILYQLATVTVLLYHAFTEPPKRLEKEPNKTQEVIPDE